MMEEVYQAAADLELLTNTNTSALPQFFRPEDGRYISSPKYFTFQDHTNDILTLKGFAVRITEDNKVGVTFTEIVRKPVYTHPRNNRRIWTGPRIGLWLEDAHGFPIGSAWNVIQLNRLCGSQDRRIFEETSIDMAYNLVGSVKANISGYTYTNC